MEVLKEAKIELPEEIQKIYEVKEYLGRGSYSIVFLVENKETKKKDALKVIDKKKVPRKERLEAEIEALKNAKHKYIIELKQTFEDDKNLYLLTEHADGGELYEKLVKRGVYSEYYASVIMKKILEAIDFLHRERDIIHRDLKPENILLVGTDDLEPRIVDFGISKLFEQSHLRPGQEGYKRKVAYSHVGSSGYTAPEILQGKGYDHSVDIWSLGVILYNIISGGTPFSDENMELQYQQITDPNRDIPFPGPWKFISNECKDLISALLDVDPLNRPSANEALRHPWIVDPEKCIKSHRAWLEEEEKKNKLQVVESPKEEPTKKEKKRKTRETDVQSNFEANSFKKKG